MEKRKNTTLLHNKGCRHLFRAGPAYLAKIPSERFRPQVQNFPLGFVKLDRRYLNWRWLPDENVCQVYLYLLLRATFQDKELYEYVIHKGELLTSYAVISEALKNLRNKSSES
ncbi:MAG: hypothetical protein IJ529_00765 [Alphaproteobacteria bacterium]|nr:hypothetical protein [Alphaproteobacteria bacterium]MBQ9235278.1 hypothetical protein [Alphaproteobacteria bacterium]